jgi:hypothetical protein
MARESKKEAARTEKYLRERATLRFEETRGRFYALSDIEGFGDQALIERIWEEVVVDEADRIRTRRTDGHDE